MYSSAATGRLALGEEVQVARDGILTRGDRFLRRSHAVDAQGAHGSSGVLGIDEAHGDVADGATGSAHHVAHLARAGENRGTAVEGCAVHDDGLERLTRYRRPHRGSRAGWRGPRRPPRSSWRSCRVDVAQLIHAQVLDRVLLVHDDGDAVVSNGDSGKAERLLLLIQPARGRCDLGGAVRDGLDARRRAQTAHEHARAVSSLKSSAACSAMVRQVVEPATVMDSVVPPALQAVSAKIVDTETAAVEMTSGMRRRTCGPGPSVL